MVTAGRQTTRVYTYAARLVSVTDGDTVRLDVDLGFGMWRVNEPYRLLRINAPEMKGRSTKRGHASKAALTAYLDGKTLTIETHKSDVYGRFLAEITVPGTDGPPEFVSDWMVAHGWAVYKDYE